MRFGRTEIKETAIFVMSSQFQSRIIYETNAFKNFAQYLLVYNMALSETSDAYVSLQTCVV